MVQIIERDEHCAIVLVDNATKIGKGGTNIFAVCPVFRDGAVDRCVDSSRYFVLRVENADGRHIFIGIAFNERNDAFDFNATLEDIRKERRLADLCSSPDSKDNNMHTNSLLNIGVADYSIKEGQKIHVSIPKLNNMDEEGWNNNSPSAEKSKRSSPKKSAFDVKSLVFGDKSQAKKKSSKKKTGAFLAPSSRDTP